MKDGEISYQDAVKGIAFRSITKDTIPQNLIPKDPEPVTAWSSTASNDLIELAKDITDSALMSLPNLFQSEFQVNGIRAQDFFSLNTLMGAAIEESVVNTLDHGRRILVALVVSKAHDNPKHDFDKPFPKFPSYLRRAAIMEAVGRVSSYQSPCHRHQGEPSLCMEHVAACFRRQRVRRTRHIRSIKIRPCLNISALV